MHLQEGHIWSEEGDRGPPPSQPDQPNQPYQWGDRCHSQIAFTCIKIFFLRLGKTLTTHIFYKGLVPTQELP